MPENPRLLLAVDTSSSVVSAALVDVGGAQPRLLGSRDVVAPNRHGELVAELIREVLGDAAAEPAALVAVAAGLGPGPFTGLRVGVVTAASLADALDVPTYGVCSLDAIAQAHHDSGDFLVCTDARRKQVYWARYDATGARTEGPDVGTPHDVATRFAPTVATVVGAGVALYPEAFAPFATSLEAHVSAAEVARMAAARVNARAPADVLEPMYLRRPDAVPPGRPKSVLPTP